MQGFFTKFPMLLSSNGQEQKNSSCLTPTSTLWRSNVVIIKEQCCYSLYYSSTLWRSDVVIIRQLCEGVMLLFVNSVKERLVVIRYIINSVKERLVIRQLCEGAACCYSLYSYEALIQYSVHTISFCIIWCTWSLPSNSPWRMEGLQSCGICTCKNLTVLF